MSGITFAAIVLATNDVEREVAKLAHYADKACKPTDAQNMHAFLGQCTTLAGEPLLRG